MLLYIKVRQLTDRECKNLAKSKIDLSYEPFFGNIKKFFSESHKVKIGILANEERPDGFGSVELAAVHEFGSMRRGIPQRSFLRQTMVNRKEDFKAEIESNKDTIMQRIADGNGKQFLQKVGATWVKYVMETFDAQGPNWAPLSPVTIANRIKNSNKILQDTGEMKKSITFKVE
jgi:phage gpG-like protein